jgi:hypothetical protein
MNLTCRSVTEVLIDFVENTLSIEERTVIQHHICGCVPCMIYVSTYKHTVMMTHRLPEEPLPEEFASRLLACLEAEAKNTES